MEINITIRIDPESKLSTGGHFLSIPTYIMYETRMSGDAFEMFVGSIEAVTVNFTAKEGNYIYQVGIIFVLGFWELPTYPSPKSAFCPKREISVNVCLGEG